MEKFENTCCLLRPVFLTKIFLYVAKDLNDIIKLKSVNSMWKDTIKYYSFEMWKE